MPLNTVYLPKVDGLQTETSNINSDPRSLADCIDVISNREDFLESRHGHPSAPVVTSVNGTATDLYAYRNETQKVFVALYKVSGVFQFKTIRQDKEEIKTGLSTQSVLQNINGISSTRTNAVNTKPVAFAHDERLLFLTDYGVYFRPYSSTVGDGSAVKVDFPLVRNATVASEWRNVLSALQEENRHWLESGYQVNVKIVFEIEAKEGDKGERRLPSPPSRIYEVKNFNLTNSVPSTRTSNMLVSISNISVSHIPTSCKVYMKVYRTAQFKIGISAITEYHLATPEIEITDTIPTEILLTANDATINTLEFLYNDSTQGGIAVTDHIPIPAKNVTQFRNYYIYSNLSIQPITQLGIKSLPSNNDTLSLKLDGNDSLPIEKTITFKASGTPGSTEVLIPSNISAVDFGTAPSSAYIANERDLTFQGLRTTQAFDINVRIKPGTGKGQVEPYGLTTKIEFIGPVTTPQTLNQTVRVYPATSGFDINRFSQPGIAAIVDSNGVIQALFPYNNYKRVASSLGFIDFEGAVLVKLVPGTIPAGGKYPTLTGNYYLYFLPGESLQGLALYYGDGSTYLSLLPCQNTLEYAIARPFSIGSDLFNSSFQVNPQYVGLLTKPQGLLLNELVTSIGDNFQKQFNTSSAVISFNYGYSAEEGILEVEVLDQRYEKISFKRSGDSVHGDSVYEPPVNTVYSTFAEAEKAISAFVISKENNPELLPYGGLTNVAGAYSPPKVGDRNKAIVACAATKDSIYFLKEDCIARMTIGFNTLVPTIETINIFDNTTFCVSAGSVQVLDDSVLFLAQNGVHAITGNNISKISRQIETELKKAISQCRNAGKLGDIRSFANSAKGLYGLHIPLEESYYVTYVLNITTMRWTKWSNQINGAVTDLDGRLTTLMTDSSGNYIRQDKYTNGDPRAEIDQVDDEFTLTAISNDVSTANFIRTITQNSLGTLSNRFTTPLGAKQVYYKTATVLYPVTVSIIDENKITVTFQVTPPAYTQNTDSLVVGVNSMLEFQPFTNGNASVLKMYSGFHIHTEESVLDMDVSFRTEARSTFSVVKKFSVSPDNRTVYRCYIPLEATRGRFLYRKITHTRPFQICAIPAQAVVFRDTGSERVNK
jgi:hypothetical protein